jgi:hypothetical protein
MTNIQQFIAAQEKKLKFGRRQPWNEQFQGAGYYSVDTHVMTIDWTGCHAWCQQQFGEDHYSWTGSTFWFETEQDALLFTLRWA